MPSAGEEDSVTGTLNLPISSLARDSTWIPVTYVVRR